MYVCPHPNVYIFGCIGALISNMLRTAHTVSSLIACGLPAGVEAATPSSLSVVKAVKQASGCLKIQFKIDISFNDSKVQGFLAVLQGARTFCYLDPVKELQFLRISTFFWIWCQF